MSGLLSHWLSGVLSLTTESDQCKDSNGNIPETSGTDWVFTLAKNLWLPERLSWYLNVKGSLHYCELHGLVWNSIPAPVAFEVYEVFNPEDLRFF
jgi:hypothetical protein